MTLPYITHEVMKRGYRFARDEDVISHLGDHYSGVSYLTRIDSKVGRIYVSLSSRENVFLEGCLKAYLTDPLTRAPKTKDLTKKGERYSEWQKLGWTPIVSGTFRGVGELVELVRVTHNDNLYSALDLATQG